jgi:hypothetical protein
MSNPFADKLAATAREVRQEREAYGRKRDSIYDNLGRDVISEYARELNLRTATAAALPVAPAPATPRQLAFVEDLLTTRDFTGETRPKYLARLEALKASREGLTRESASALIEYLLTMPKAQVKAPETGDVPAGKYAVEINGTLTFAIVDRPEEGRWAGYTFVSQQVSDERIRINRRRQQEILEAIRTAGFKEASIRYGHELGKCGVCGRTLTNEASREAGIGPKCQANMGW